MKKTPSSARKRSPSTKTARTAAVSRSGRPLRKRILLHPFTIMVLLCTGVILAGSTYRSIAASYDVTATVPADPPSAPAIIVDPFDSQHFSTSQIAVSGSCPAGTYVKVYRNNAFNGVASCSNHAFQVQIGLERGPNQLQARVYNVTNIEGPQSPVLTVYYDETVVTPPSPAPSSPPTTLTVQNVEQSDYQKGSIEITSINPTVSGYAPPFSDVTVTFHSVITTCKTKADVTGWWTCTLDNPLPPGLHWVDVEAVTTDGAHLQIPSFQIQVQNGRPTALKPFSNSPPLLIISEYQFQTHFVGQPFTWSLGVNGGTPPYNMYIDWGDGSQSNMGRPNGASFSLTHAYPEAKTYIVFVKTTDARGETAMLQLSAAVKGQAIGAASLTSRGPIAALFASVQHYVWIVWPVYIAVVLMAFSYWLGEQEMYQRLRRRRLERKGGRTL